MYQISLECLCSTFPSCSYLPRSTCCCLFVLQSALSTASHLPVILCVYTWIHLFSNLHTSYTSTPPWHFSAAYNPQAEPLCREAITCQLCLFLAITMQAHTRSAELFIPHSQSKSNLRKSYDWGQHRLSRPSLDRSFTRAAAEHWK